MLLTFLGRPEQEERIRRAVRSCLEADLVTRELGGRLSTSEAGQAVLDRLG